MNQIIPTIKLHTCDQSKGTYINALILSHNGNNYHMDGSTGDTIYVFTESICLYVLIINNRRGYMALNAYMSPEPDPINSIYLHSLYEIKETLGHKWESLAPAILVSKLIDYLL